MRLRLDNKFRRREEKVSKYALGVLEFITLRDKLTNKEIRIFLEIFLSIFNEHM